MIVFNVCMCLHEWDVSPVKGSCLSSLLVISILFFVFKVKFLPSLKVCSAFVLLYIEVQPENKFYEYNLYNFFINQNKSQHFCTL